MAEQGEKAKSEAQVRKVLYREQVFFHAAATLGGEGGKLETDLEGRAGKTHKATGRLTATGVLIRWTGIEAGKETGERQKLVPWSTIREVDLSPEFRP